jgi:hypothetical protein
MTTQPLKLKAEDAEDVQVISAVLQDAIAPVCDMLYNPADKNFIMVVHRLRRETEDAPLERICCAVNLRGVESVKTHGIDLNKQERMLDLLAVMPEKQTVDFIFAGDAEIRVQLGAWSMIVEDFGEAWPASCSPCHDAATG